jgi:membrane protein
MTDDSQSRGRGATRPRDIPRPGWRDIGLRTWHAVGSDHVTVVAAGVAFYGLLALFPAIAAFVAVAGLILDEATMQAQIAHLSAALPEDAAAIIDRAGDAGRGRTARPRAGARWWASSSRYGAPRAAPRG